MHALQSEGVGTVAENYARLIGIARGKLGPDMIWCDSSKSILGLHEWTQAWQAQGVARDELLVLHIAKDARNWVAAEKARHRSGLLAVYRRFSLWKAANRHIAEAVAQEGLRSLTIGYEELCLDTAGSIERLCAALQLPEDAAMHDLRNTHAHVGAGNGSRLRAASAGLRYDQRPSFDWVVDLCYLLRPGLRRSNRRHAYPVQSAPVPTG